MQDIDVINPTMPIINITKSILHGKTNAAHIPKIEIDANRNKKLICVFFI
jgi:hypothetical protein